MSDQAADPVSLKLRRFGDLPDGWSHGRGIGISQGVIAKAYEILSFGTQLQLRAEVFAGLEGEVAVALYQSDVCVQVTVNPDLSMGLRVEKGYGFQYEDLIEPSERVENESEIFSHIAGLVRYR